MAIPTQMRPGDRLFNKILTVLARIGYTGDIVETNYGYSDRFVSGHPERRVDAALFGRTPTSFDTALFGIAIANGARGAELVNAHRSLGAPVILEVRDDVVGVWGVGKDESSSAFQEELNEERFGQWVAVHEEELRPLEFLRTKELRGGPTFIQGHLFAGLIPELENEIGKSLDPILREAIRAGIDTYHETTRNRPPEANLFKLAFWLLTGKVFSDRGHPDFADLNAQSDPDTVLDRVAAHYKETTKGLLNRKTRLVVFDRVWDRMDFRNLSVEVLSQIWSRTLVTEETRKRLGIHRTRKSIVRYIIDRIPFEEFAPEDRRVLEPCSGSATFLIAAMDRMRAIPPAMPDPIARHAYFQRMLTGFERDPFGEEISRLCLALADYPSPNGWDIKKKDVFTSTEFKSALNESRIVLCNPPFEDFDPNEYEKIQPQSPHQPVELLGLVLESLHPEGVLGFVLPKSFVDSKGYRKIRQDIARRYASIDIVTLPGKGWDYADRETALLVATNPIAHVSTSVSYATVNERDWRDFEWLHAVNFRDSEEKTIEQTSASFAVLELKELWDYLDYCPKLKDIADVHKGVEWTLNQESHHHLLVLSAPTDRGSYRLGVPPQASPFYAFERPPVAYLNFDERYQRRPASFARPWSKPKVILNRGRKSRPGPWKLVAYADTEGLACFETFLGVWPKTDQVQVTPLAAVLNGPVANAYVTIRETGRNIVVDTVRQIPVPILKASQRNELIKLVSQYVKSVESAQIFGSVSEADRVLRQIDSLVMEAYSLPPRLERRLLDYFSGYHKRPVPFPFADYFPRDFAPWFTLKEWLTKHPELSTVERFRAHSRDLPDHILRALESAARPVVEGDE